MTLPFNLFPMSMETVEKTKLYATLQNQGTISVREIPVLSPGQFTNVAEELLNSESRHCVNYYAYPVPQGLKFIFDTEDLSDMEVEGLIQ